MNRLMWMGLGLTGALVVLALTLVVLNTRGARGQPLPVYGQVADFTLTNQNGRPISLADLRGHVWVADIIFTRCPGPCLKMTRQMKELQQALSSRSRTRLVTLTSDADFDTPLILKAYAARFGADTNRWTFLTGTRKQIVSLAVNSLKLSVVEKKPEERESPDDLFVHSTIFVLLDKQGRLRGVFETSGDGIDPEQVKRQILAGIRQLEREPG
jgi:protein SCO1/2